MGSSHIAIHLAVVSTWSELLDVKNNRKFAPCYKRTFHNTNLFVLSALLQARCLNVAYHMSKSQVTSPERRLPINK